MKQASSKRAKTWDRKYYAKIAQARGVDQAAGDRLQCQAGIPDPITQRISNEENKIQLQPCDKDVEIHEFAEVTLDMIKHTEADPYNYYIYTDASVPKNPRGISMVDSIDIQKRYTRT